MNAEILSGALYIIIVWFCFAVLLGLGEWVFNLLYRFIPRFRKWWDNYCDSLPNWDEEKEVY